MWLDRSLIKKQAKELIKNSVLKLFGITLIIFIILNAFGVVYNITNHSNIFSAFNEYNDYGGYEDYFNENFGDGRNSYADEFKQFDNSGNSSFEEEFNNFGTDGSAQNYEDNFNSFGTDGSAQNYEDNFNSFGGHIALPAAADAQTAALSGFSVNYTLNLLTFAIALVVIFLAPLSVALSYFYVEYVTGKEFEFDSGLKSVFRNAFKVTYLKKVAVAFLKELLILLLSILFLIPGIVFNYSSYFAFEIMAEYPELSPWQAISLSKKMVKGNRTELFVLDLSFIPWMLLCVFIFPVIYVWPYMFTTRALYYENFKLRALAMHRITEDDFLSDAQKMNRAMNGGAPYQQQAPYGTYTAQNAAYPPNGAAYQQNPQQNTQGYGNAYPGAQNPQQPQAQYGGYNPAGNRQYANNYAPPQQGAPYQPTPPYPQGGYAPTMQQPYGPAVSSVYFTPVMPAQRAAQAAAEFNSAANAASAQSTPGMRQNENSPTATDDSKTAANGEQKPDITITKPQEPAEPEYAEPQEPTESFTEPQEPEEPKNGE